MKIALSRLYQSFTKGQSLNMKLSEILHCWIFQELMPDIKEIKPSEPVLDFGNEDEKIFDNEEDVRDVKIRRTVVS